VVDRGFEPLVIVLASRVVDRGFEPLVIHDLPPSRRVR
jgi:hypothetical protein